MSWPFLCDDYSIRDNFKFITKAYIFTIQDTIYKFGPSLIYINKCLLHMAATSEIHYTLFSNKPKIYCILVPTNICHKSHMGYSFKSPLPCNNSPMEAQTFPSLLDSPSCDQSFTKVFTCKKIIYFAIFISKESHW
jgi:hypothetical protein